MGIRKGGEKLKKKTCCIYTRVSTAAQTEGYSLDAQKERLRQFAEYKDLEIVGEYCDAGKSGHSIKGRPSFMEMLDDITAEKDGISFVLVYKLSRFGRNAADVLKSILDNFDRLFRSMSYEERREMCRLFIQRMTDLEKKQFMRTFIESIELYPEKKDNGRIISTIELRFPVYYTRANK